MGFSFSSLNPVKAVKKVFKDPEKLINPAASLGTSIAVDETQRAFKDLGESLAPEINFPDPPEAAKEVDLAGAMAAEAERKRNRSRKGRASTILTSPQGVTGSASIGTKTLLGE